MRRSKTNTNQRKIDNCASASCSPQSCACGLLAIILMLFHAGWATFTFVRGNEKTRGAFHTFSTVVWLVWLIPYVIGLLVGVPMIHPEPVCVISTSVIAVGLIALALFIEPSRK